MPKKVLYNEKKLWHSDNERRERCRIHIRTVHAKVVVRSGPKSVGPGTTERSKKQLPSTGVGGVCVKKIDPLLPPFYIPPYREKERG